MNHATIIAQRINFSLVQLPGRSFPALTVQGDSLKAIEQAVDELKSLVDPSGESHLAASVEEVSELLSAFIEEYEDMMAEAKITLPYQ